MILVFDGVDQGHAGLAGPAQYFHLRLVFRSIGTGAVHHIEDGGAPHDRREQLHLIREIPAAVVVLHK